MGSAFVKLLIKRAAYPLVIDKLTYAGDLSRLKDVKGEFTFYKADICNQSQIDKIFAKEKPEIVVHFAAESHVDRSLNKAAPFIETNIKGTLALIDICRKHNIRRFVFISTDEVYGEVLKGSSKESSIFKPSSPYAASKAAADLLVQSYIRSYKFPAIIVRPSNNYGPWQYPEKLIPLAILKIIEGGKVPLYGKGRNIRQWLYVDDCAEGILAAVNKGVTGQAYNLGSKYESSNIKTIRLLLKVLGIKQNRLEFVKDRPGHDIRYSLDYSKAYKDLKWYSGVEFIRGLKYTAAWSLENREWIKSKSGEINKLYR